MCLSVYKTIQFQFQYHGPLLLSSFHMRGATIQFWFENCYLVLVWGQLSNHIYLQGLWIGAIGSGVREEEGKRGKRKRRKRKRRKRKRKRMTKLFWVQSFCYRDAEPNAFSQKKVETQNAPKHLKHRENTQNDFSILVFFYWLVWFFCIGWVGFGLKTLTANTQSSLRGLICND